VRLLEEINKLEEEMGFKKKAYRKEEAYR